MGKRIGLIIQYIIFLGGGIFLVWWQFSKMTLQEYKDFKFALYNADYRVLIPIIFIAVSIFISRAMRWRIMIAPMGYTPSFFNTFGATMAGFLANTFLPRIGEILKCTILGKYEKIPVQKLIGTVVIERIFDLLCYLILILFTFFIQYKLVGSFIKDALNKIVNSASQPLWITVLLIAAIITAATLIFRFVFKKYAGGKIAIKTKNFLAGLKEGISSILKLQKRGWFLFHTIYIWSMYLLQVYIGFSAFADLSHLGFNAACAVLTLATFANIITPGGLGAFPTAIFLVLSLYNINQTTGEAFGWLMWGVTTFIILFFGLLFLGLLYFSNRKKQSIKK
jgi:glycosyltransferase 2 family protein